MTSTLKFLHVNDFAGGLVTNAPATELQLNQSPDLDNITYVQKAIRSREGDVEFNATAMNSGTNVQGIAYYKPTSGTEYLVAVCGAKLFNSDALDGTMHEITGALTIGAGQDKIWSFAFLNDLLVGVGGAPDAPFKWSGVGDGAVLGGSPVSGNFCFAMKDRMFIGSPTANPSTLYWSILSNCEDWSGVGSGNTTLVTNDGDKLVGGIPLNNDLALLFKNYSIHHLVVTTAPFPTKAFVPNVGCCGKNAMVNVNGVVYFITNQPRLKATDGYQIIDLPPDIDDIFDGLNRSRLQYIQAVYVAKLNQIHFYCSYGSATTNNYCIVWDLENKCFLRYTTGFDCNVACIVSGSRLMGGHYNGKVYEKFKASTYTDASEGSVKVSSYWHSGWINNSNEFQVKQVKVAEVSYQTQVSGSLNFSYGYDFQQGINNTDFSIAAIGGTWGNGTWGNTFIWGSSSQYMTRVYLLGTRGNVFQFKMSNKDSTQMYVYSIDFGMRTQGVKEFIAD
jgi:hypothetical protein